MNFEKDRDSKKPMYAQLAKKIEKDILDGKLKPGERLPAERALGDKIGVSRNTIKQAYEALCKKKLAETRLGSGTYVSDRDLMALNAKAEKEISETVDILCQQLLGYQEIERLLRESAWENLPENEKINLALIDCGPEMISYTAKELSNFCNVNVDIFILEKTVSQPEVLFEKNYDMLVTTINHFDEIAGILENIQNKKTRVKCEMIVLSVSNFVISSLIRIQDEMKIAIIYESEWYRFSVECFLKEFGIKGVWEYINLREANKLLFEDPKKYHLAIFPPDFDYRKGLIGILTRKCAHYNIRFIPFEEVVDQGSLIHIKKKAQEIWLEK